MGATGKSYQLSYTPRPVREKTGPCKDPDHEFIESRKGCEGASNPPPPGDVTGYKHSEELLVIPSHRL